MIRLLSIGAAVLLSSTARANESVKIVGSDLLLMDNAPRIAELVTQHGGVVKEVRRNTKPRSKTTVYARPEGMKTAQKIASKLGTEVEPLAQGKFPVVVALGTDMWAGISAVPKPLSSINYLDFWAWDVDVEGWTEDDRFFVVRRSSGGCCGDPLEKAIEILVLDTYRGEVTTFLFDIKVRGVGSRALGQARESFFKESVGYCGKCGRAPQWKSWLQSHPLVAKEPANHRGPVTLKLIAPSGDVKWTDALTWIPTKALAWIPEDGTGCGRREIYVKTQLRYEDGRVTATRFPSLQKLVCEEEIGQLTTTAFVPHFSPHGTRVGWLMKGVEHQFENFSYGVAFTAGDRPSVVLAIPQGEGNIVSGLRERLAAAGATIVGISPAKKLRAQTVVYAPAAFASDAKALLTALPPNAKVETLVWKAAADIVIAVGADALKK